MAALAPLLAGGVHRGPQIALITATAAGLLLLSVALAAQGRALRLDWTFTFALAFVVIPLAQSIPLPPGLRALLDPHGSSLLNDFGTTQRWWPLSLDPPSTRGYIGRAAMGLAVFIITYHLAAGQTARYLVMRAIALTGLAAVVIGVGHRIFGIPKLYGVLIATHRSLVIGPFVNANHTAELLELAAFVCLACSFLKPTMLNRVGWLVGAALCIGGAALTLSRGAIAALGAAVLMFMLLHYLSRDDAGPGRRRAALAWGGFLLALALLAGATLGAGQLLDRFSAGSVTGDVRFRVWRDSLKVLAAHPMGIGRGAFDHAYPIYKTVTTPFPLRFAFVENEPLQLFIDAGWVLGALPVIGGAFIAWRLARFGRRDKVEAALVAGLFAVLVHNLVDFGLETAGVLLPFLAILGTVLGRMRPASGAVAPRAGWVVAAFACAAAVFGAGSLAHASADDFDKLLKEARDVGPRRSILARASVNHPVDYFYALASAKLEPLTGAPGEPSPRFKALNRALALCPSCEAIHVEVARNLWSLNRRSQAVMEWRTAVQLQPSYFAPTLGELHQKGARPEELAALAVYDSKRLIEVADFLARADRLPSAFIVLQQAETLGARGPELRLTRLRLEVQAGRAQAAAASLARAKEEGVSSAQMTMLEANVIQLLDPVGGPARALDLLDAGAVRYADDVDLQRMRLGLVTKLEKWTAVPRALEGFKQALYGQRGSATEAHISAARIFMRLSRWGDAFGAYRIALAEQPNDVGLWMEFGRAGETAGQTLVAREAYAQAARLSANNPDIISATKRVDERLRKQRSGGNGFFGNESERAK